MGGGGKRSGGRSGKGVGRGVGLPNESNPLDAHISKPRGQSRRKTEKARPNIGNLMIAS